MLLLDVLLELVAAVLAVGAVGTAVLRVAAALERHVPHEVLARVVAALAVGALVALLRLVLRARQRQPLAAREDVVARLGLGRGGRAGALAERRGLGGQLLVLLGVLGRRRGGPLGRRRLDRLEDRERGRLHGNDVLLGIFFTTRHDISRRRSPTCKRKWNTVRFSVDSNERS